MRSATTFMQPPLAGKRTNVYNVFCRTMYTGPKQRGVAPRGHNVTEMERLNGTEAVLVVDDEKIGLSMAHAMLTRYGYGVFTASSGEEALRLFEQWPDLRIDIAVIDIVMPVMDGFELTKRIREVRPQLPI